MNARDRIGSAVRITNSGCWDLNSKPNRSGYKRICVDSVRDYGHRHSHRAFIGPIPDGFDVDHLCRNRACCNPAHLEAVDHRTNLLRGDTFAASQHSQSGCRKFNHPLTLSKNGHRYCKPCKNQNRRGKSTS